MAVGAIVVNLEKTHTYSIYLLFTGDCCVAAGKLSWSGYRRDDNWRSSVLSVGCLVAAALGARVIVIYTSLSASHIHTTPPVLLLTPVPGTPPLSTTPIPLERKI
jgi:hypothetical protein